MPIIVESKSVKVNDLVYIYKKLEEEKIGTKLCGIKEMVKMRENKWNF